MVGSEIWNTARGISQKLLPVSVRLSRWRVGVCEKSGMKSSCWKSARLTQRRGQLQLSGASHLASLSARAMANQGPDARDLASWEDAFQYPLPVIRKLEQQLRSGANDNREKVRALVGSGYRDLLGTADRIIEMDGEMHRLEDIIADIGQKCNSRVITKIASNHERLTRHRAEEKLAHRRPAAEVALLHSCLTTCRGLLKGNGEPLLAARLLLLARLLQNSASKSAEGSRLLKSQRLKLSALRNRLLLSIEERLAAMALSRAQMMDLLLAYSLVTTSSLADVLRHLLRVRQQSIKALSDLKKRKSTIKAIDLLVATLDQAHSVFPRRMAEAMERTTGPHLLQDEDLRSALEFDLNTYERWVSTDIRSFVPWLRNNDLSKDNLSTIINQWAQTAASTIMTGLQSLLALQTSPLRINSLREKTIRHLLGTNTPSTALDKDNLLMRMRQLFRERLFAVTTERADIIKTAISDVINTGISKDHRVRNIWDQESSKVDLRRGAQAFRHNIVTRSEGKDETLQRLDTAVSGWAASVEDIRKAAKEMRQTRWADELELEDDAETKAEGERYQTLLATADPTDLLSHLTKETEAALLASMEAVSAEAQGLSKDAAPGPKALYLLRIIRLIPIPESNTTSALTELSTSILEILHSTLAASILSTTTSSNTSLEQSLFSSTPATQLWHAPTGQPALPTLPSPGSYRLLRAVSKAMTDVGVDTWTPAAVRATKLRIEALVVRAAEAFSSAEGGPGTKPEPDGQSDGAETAPAEGKQDAPADGSQADMAVARATQALFDAVYLREALSSQTGTAVAGKQSGQVGGLQDVVQRFRTESKIGEQDFERLVRSAGTYHRRSYMLFGVLAGS